MPAFSFLHAADLHLDTPFSGLGRVSAELRKRLIDASLEVLDELIAAAISRRVDFVVIAGDIYDGAERGTRAQFRFKSGLERLHGAGIRAFFIHGNHDPVEEGWSALRSGELPSSARLFDRSDIVESEVVERDGVPVAIVHGISFRTRRETRNLSRLFPARRTSSLFQIGLLHCNVGARSDHGDYAPCSLEDLTSKEIDYWALGHVHAREVLRSEKPFVVYSGNTQGRGFDECGARSATLVRVDAIGNASLEEIRLGGVRFERLRVDTSGCESLDAIFRLVEHETELLKSASGASTLLLRVQLTGQCGAHADLARADESEELVEILRERMNSTGLWLESLEVSTIPVVDREQLRSGIGFTPALIEVRDEIGAAPERMAEFQESIERALRTGVRFREFIPEPSTEATARRLERAEARLLGLLESEDAEA